LQQLKVDRAGNNKEQTPQRAKRSDRVQTLYD
jgi:hypothetical protein